MKPFARSFAVFLGACALLLPLAGSAAPAARIVSVEENKAQGRLSRFRGAGLQAFDQLPDMTDASFSVRWYAAPPGAPAGTLLCAECMFARSHMPRTFFAPQREPTEGYKTSEITVPGSMVARYGQITSWQVTLSYRGTVIDRWVSPAGWTPVGELPQVGMNVPVESDPAPADRAPPAAPAVKTRDRMTIRPDTVLVPGTPAAKRSAPAQPAAPQKPAATARPQAALPAATAKPAAVRPSTVQPRRPANPDAPVGWSPSSPAPGRPARAASPAPASPARATAPAPAAPHVRRPLAVQPSRPATNAATRSLP